MTSWDSFRIAGDLLSTHKICDSFFLQGNAGDLCFYKTFTEWFFSSHLLQPLNLLELPLSSQFQSLQKPALAPSSPGLLLSLPILYPPKDKIAKITRLGQIWRHIKRKWFWPLAFSEDVKLYFGGWPYMLAKKWNWNQRTYL